MKPIIGWGGWGSMITWPRGIIPLGEEEYKRLKEKADKWDQYAIYDNQKEAEIPVEDLIVAYERLKSVKNWYLMFNQNIDSEAVKDKLWEILNAAG